MQEDIRFAVRSLKIKYRSWGTDEVMYPSRKSVKDALQGRLCLLRCDNITYGTAARGNIYKYEVKNSSTKNVQDFCRSFIVSMNVMSHVS